MNVLEMCQQSQEDRWAINGFLCRWVCIKPGFFFSSEVYVNNVDKPGFIGSLGVMLGDAGINIATFNLGRQSQGEEAVALVGIDAEIPEDVVKKIEALPQVRYVKVLTF